MTDQLRATFVMEQQIGHRTYGQNLRAATAGESDVLATWAEVTYEQPGGIIERVPVLPAGLRGALRGRRQVRTAVTSSSPDAVLFFTQVPAVLGGRRARRPPYVIVLDDTPILFDQMGEHYGHRPDRFAPTRRLKRIVNERTLQGAAFVLPFSRWARQSLIDDYGVDQAKIDVIPSGVDISRWIPADRHDSRPLRILFVGGDFERKGGPTMLDAIERLPHDSYEVDIVTRSAVPTAERIRVHGDLEPNSDALRALFRGSDVFVMPSLAEAFGHVVVEAAASGLPAIVSDVGGMPEIVVPGETGFVVPPGDDRSIAEILLRFVEEPDLRAGMGAAARSRAETLFDASKNGRRTVQRLRDAAAT